MCECARARACVCERESFDFMSQFLLAKSDNPPNPDVQIVKVLLVPKLYKDVVGAKLE